MVSCDEDNNDVCDGDPDANVFRSGVIDGYRDNDDDDNDDIGDGDPDGNVFRSGVIGGYRLLWITMWASLLGFIMQVSKILLSSFYMLHDPFNIN